MKFELRDYQIKNAEKAAEIIKELGIVYLAMEVRTGKTLTALQTAFLLGCKKVLFVTKKKAIGSIKRDYGSLNPGYFLEVINYESLHKIDGDFDLIVIDEAHRLGAFPKPCLAAKRVKERFYKKPMIFLSGTPSPESYSQLFHQFWVSQRSPWVSYKNFYRWCDDYVTVTERMIGSTRVRDYSKAHWEKIEAILKPYMISYTQKEAGFQVELKEHFLYIPVDPRTQKIIDLLIADRAVKGSSGTITACNPAVLQQKIQQLYSGTIILDPENEGDKGKPLILSKRKAEYISYKWPTEKLVIFYQFQAELTVLKEVFGDRLTNDIDEFNKDPSKSYVGQFVSSREGVNLSKGDLIIAFNISHSATTYQQFRDRMTTIDRQKSDIYWIFSEGGIEEKIYRAVKNKENYTSVHFTRDFMYGTGRATEIVQSA